MPADPVRSFSTVPGTPPEAVAAPASILEELRAELTDSTEEHVVTLEVPGRAGWAVRYSADIDYPMLKAWAKSSTSKADGADELKFSTLLLASQARAIVRQGIDLEDQGLPLVFASPKMIELTGATSSTDAVKRLYGRDSHVIASANTLMAEAGYGEDVSKADPQVR